MLDEQIAFLRKAAPHIPKVVIGRGPRPFWSVVIPTYGRPDHLPQALASVLDQDPGPERMAIEVMDDASPTDDNRRIVEALGRGRVTYYRQRRNLGQFRNVNGGIRRARGRWIHVLHDDDYVQPGFYAKLHASLVDQPNVGAALTAITIQIENPNRSEYNGKMIEWPLRRPTPGVLPDWLETCATNSFVQTPAVVVRREVYETLGGYNPDFPWPGDWEMWQRIAAHYAWWYQPDARAIYREHLASVSGHAKRTGSNVADVSRAIAFAQHYLPPDRAAELGSKALRFWSNYVYRTAMDMIRAGDHEGACAQLAELLRLNPIREVVMGVITMGRAVLKTGK